MFLYKINVLNISQTELPTFHHFPVPSHSLPPILLLFRPFLGSFGRLLLHLFLRADGVLKKVECFCQFVELVLDILDLLRYAVVLVVVVAVVARCHSRFLERSRGARKGHVMVLALGLLLFRPFFDSCGRPLIHSFILLRLFGLLFFCWFFLFLLLFLLLLVLLLFFLLCLFLFLLLLLRFFTHVGAECNQRKIAHVHAMPYALLEPYALLSLFSSSLFFSLSFFFLFFTLLRNPKENYYS